jgi:hypothetical protein
VIREGENKWNEKVKKKQISSNRVGSFCLEPLRTVGPDPHEVFHRVARDSDGGAKAW